MHMLFVIVLTTVTFETVMPDVYAKIVNPLSYYANTRSWVAAKIDDQADVSGFYLGAQRAERATLRIAPAASFSSLCP
ncbi:hypothetical protein AJ87_47515 [Rhizobium yanglingense]|nr:hypothetical protein AJ87_47515 [Rhizobium yanglingense]